ncbi:hypothetical protein EJB05_52007, partial [Eragrostis curvula]
MLRSWPSRWLNSVPGTSTTGFEPIVLTTLEFMLYTQVWAQLVGIDNAKDELINMLSSQDDKLKTISIVGFGGLGKTTLAKAVNEKLKENFQCGAFVSVGQNPETEQVLKNILYDLQNRESKDIFIAPMGQHQLIEELQDFLRNKRYIQCLPRRAHVGLPAKCRLPAHHSDQPISCWLDAWITILPHKKRSSAL